MFDKGVPVRERLQRVEPWGIGPRFGKAAFPNAGKMKVLDGQCAAREEGWWHYEVCHGRNVTQFRTKPVENCVGCHPERTNVHSLGIFDGIVPAVAADGDGDKEPEHEFVAGDGCGADQMARYTKVVYKCVAGVWALDDRIESIHEYEMCKYRIVVLTSKACNESLHHSVQSPHSPVGTTRLHSGTWQRGGLVLRRLSAVTDTNSALNAGVESESGSVGADSQGSEEAASVSRAEGLSKGEVGGGSVMVEKVATTVALIEDALVVRKRLGIKARHCFNLGQSCSMSMWLWLQDPRSAKLVGIHDQQAEQSVVVVKGPPHTVAPHVLYGFSQAPGHLFCGLHTVSDNQMVGSFTSQPVPTETWVHFALVFHHSTAQGPQRRFECVVNGRVMASVVAPDSLRPLTKDDRSVLIVGGSHQYHPAAPGIAAKVHMHHRQALDIASILRLMRAWPESDRPRPRPSSVGAATSGAVVAGVAGVGADGSGAGAGGEGEGEAALVGAQGSGDAESAVVVVGKEQEAGASDLAAAAQERARRVVIARPGERGNAGSSALWTQVDFSLSLSLSLSVRVHVIVVCACPDMFSLRKGIKMYPRRHSHPRPAMCPRQVDEVLAGNEQALMVLGYKHLHGIHGVARSCPVAAAYYKGAAENAVKDMESPDAVHAEFVRLSHEIEKGNAFEGHKGEEDDVFRFQEAMAEQGNTQAQAWMGHRYYWGVGGVERDRARALQYLQRAANAGNVEAQYNLGVMYAYGHGVEKDRNASLALFRKAADGGYTAAFNGLALSLTDGSPDNNLTEAFHYFNRSAAAGNADGLYNSALLLRDGRGIAKDEATALDYLRRAVGADHQAARIQLGTMLIEGRGAAPDCPGGVGLLKDAAERGRWGILLRDGLEAYMHGDVRAAIRSYTAAAELGIEVVLSGIRLCCVCACACMVCLRESVVAVASVRVRLAPARF